MAAHGSQLWLLAIVFSFATLAWSGFLFAPVNAAAPGTSGSSGVHHAQGGAPGAGPGNPSPGSPASSQHSASGGAQPQTPGGRNESNARDSNPGSGNNATLAANRAANSTAAAIPTGRTMATAAVLLTIAGHFMVPIF